MKVGGLLVPGPGGDVAGGAQGLEQREGERPPSPRGAAVGKAFPRAR